MQNKKIHELKSSGFSSMIKDLFNDKINKKILKLKDLEINERLLKTITAPPSRLALSPLPPLHCPPPAPFFLLGPPSIHTPINQRAMQQGLIKARNYLRPAGKESIFNPKTEEKIYHNNKNI